MATPKDIIEGGGPASGQPSPPSTEALQNLTGKVEDATTALQNGADLLKEKAVQLSAHERVLADKDKYGHFKAGSGFVLNEETGAHDVDFPEAVGDLVAPAVNDAVESAVEIMGADAAATLAAAASKVADAAGYATASATSATASANSATAANTAKSGAESAKSAADSSKTAAATSATNAASSATAAAASASTASTKATEAANSATAAKTSQTAAETAKTGAETALAATKAVIASPTAADANKKLLAAGAGTGKWAANASLVSKANSGRAAIAVNGTFTVPSYVVGANQLSVYLEGCLCDPGVEYNEVGMAGVAGTSIKWLMAVPTDYTISVKVTP